MSDVKAAVDEEFERVWSGLIVDMQEPMRRLKSFRAAGATSDGGNANAQALPAIAITATTTTTAVKPPDAPSAMAKLTFHDNATIQIPMDTSLNGTFMAGTLVTAPSTLSKLTPDGRACRGDC